MGKRCRRLAIVIITFAFTAAAGFAHIQSFAESGAYDGNASIKPPAVSAKSAIVIEQLTGKVLFENNSRQRVYPASITKIVTAVLAIESESLDRVVSIPGSCVGVEGSSIYLTAGEKLMLRDLVYGLMLRSGNDAALAISCLLEPSTEKFVERMNMRVKEMGALDTHFVNPNGLFNENHYTTAYDMAIIAREAMKNPEFKTVAGAKAWVAKRGDGKYNHFFNKNKVVFDYSGGTGIKIGYTKRSGRTLVASAERNGMGLICVVMDAPDWFNDSYKLMDYVFGCFEMQKIAESQKTLKAIPVKNGNKDHVFIGPADRIELPVLKGKVAKTELIYRHPSNTKAPIRRFQEAGALELYSEGEYLCSYPLYYLEDIDLAILR